MNTNFVVVVLFTTGVSILERGEGNEGRLRCSSIQQCKCTKMLDQSIKADCSKLHLEFIPIFYGHVSNIDLSYNNLSFFFNNGEVPSSVTYLDLSYNTINRFSDTAFQRLSRLEWLNLKSNNLSYVPSVFKPGIFAHLGNLKVLNIQQNLQKNISLTKYPTAIADIKTLTSLFLDGQDNTTFDLLFKEIDKLEVLTLSGSSGNCYIKSLTGDLFVNTPFLRHLDISGCDIRTIANGTLQPLTRLQHLNISHNKHLTFRALPNITYDLQKTDIKVVDVSKIHCTYGPGTILYDEDLHRLQNTTLEELYLDSNRLVIGDEDLFKSMSQTLKLLSVRDNRLTMGKYTLFVGLLVRLESFNGNNQYTSHNPTADTNRFNLCNDWRGPGHLDDRSELKSYQKPSQNVLNNNDLRKLHTHFFGPRGHYKSLFPIPLPPNLSNGRFESSNLKYPIPELKFVQNNSLSRLYFRNNILHSWQGPIHNLNSLKYLDLSQNLCSNLSSVFFPSLPSISVLNISNNLLGFVLSKKGSIDPFRNLRKLSSLDLSFNRIESLSQSIFRDLYNMKHLYLNSNSLTEWDFEFNHMKKLQRLDLSKNQLSFIPKSVRDVIDMLRKSNNFTINLLGNPFRCDCNTTSVEFVKWISITQKKYNLFTNFSEYICITVDFKRIRFSDLDDLIKKLERDCGSHLALIVGVTAAILLCVTGVVFGIGYRYRWKVRYLYYIAKNKYLNDTAIRDYGDNAAYTFDVFVSYVDENSPFVRNNFLLEIEDRHNLKACLHERDFIPGRRINDNIINAIHNSRKTVVILSPDYLKSYWCTYEFQMARMESVYSRVGENVLFLIVYEHVPKEKLSLEILYLMENDSYIEYPNDPDHGDLVFWESVAQAIRH